MVDQMSVGMTPTTFNLRAPLLPKYVVTSRLRCGQASRKVQEQLGARACKEDIDRPGSGTGLSAGSATTQSSSTRRHRCKLLRTSNKSDGGLATVVHFACNDAMLMSAAAQNLDERARNDVALLAQGILRLDMRARRDVALISSGFLKLDARAREDTEKLDIQARQKVKRLRRIALELQDIARIEAEEHWSDGALDADLRLADIRARRRVMEDAFVSVQVVKNLHSALVKILQMRECESGADLKRTDSMVAKDVQYTTGSVALDRLIELEEAYLSMASLLAETDGIDCTDPDEVPHHMIPGEEFLKPDASGNLEFVVATLLDMDEVAGGSGASLLAECATSPDVATRRALADVLADAPSLWTLGNAGMGALQRLAMDSNAAVAAAATKAIEEFNQQWRVEDQNTFLFPQSGQPKENSEFGDESDKM